MGKKIICKHEHYSREYFSSKPSLTEEITQAMYSFIYLRDALFRNGRGPQEQVECFLNKVMDNIADDFTTFTLVTIGSAQNPLVISGKDALREFYFHDATQTFAGYSLHAVFNISAMPHPAPCNDKRKYARMRAYHFDMVRVTFNSQDYNLFISGDYDIIWVKEDDKWLMYKIYVSDDRILDVSAISAWSRQYSGTSPDLPNYITLPFPPCLAWPNEKSCYPPCVDGSENVTPLQKNSKVEPSSRYAIALRK